MQGLITWHEKGATIQLFNGIRENMKIVATIEASRSTARQMLSSNQIKYSET